MGRPTTQRFWGGRKGAFWMGNSLVWEISQEIHGIFFWGNEVMLRLQKLLTFLGKIFSDHGAELGAARE